MHCLRHCRTKSHTQQKFSWSWNSGLARAGEGGESWHLLFTSEEPEEPGTDWVMPAPPTQILEIRRWDLAQQFKASCVFRMLVAKWPQKDMQKLWFGELDNAPQGEQSLGLLTEGEFLRCSKAVRKDNHSSGFAGEEECSLFIDGIHE